MIILTWKQFQQSTLIILLQTFDFAFSQSTIGNLSCPQLTCNALKPYTYDSNLCYLHQGSAPEDATFQVYSCQNVNQFCNVKEGTFQYDKNGFWYNKNNKMDYSASKLAGFCSDQSAIYKNLKPGTSCQYDYQCSCQRCEDYICRGAFAGDPCRTNVECSSNYFCGSLICARTNSTDSTKCMTRWSLFEGTYSVDPRLCMSGYTTTKGICSHILQVYQAKNTTLTCDINTNKGGCETLNLYEFYVQIDGSNRTDLVPCQCSIFDSTTSYCRWPGLSSQLRYLQLLQKLYSQSPYCSRAYFNDDPLQIKFAELKQCTSLDQDTFSELVQYAHKWLYAAPLKSPLYNEECLNEFAVTSPKLMGMIRTQANYEIQMENALVNQLCIVLNILLVLTYVLF